MKKLLGPRLKKEANIGKLIKGSSLLSLSQFASKGIAFLLLPILTRYLSPKDFGVISIFTIIYSFISMLSNPGLVSGSIRKFYDTNDEQERKLIVGSSYLFFLVVPLLLLVFLLLFGEILTKKFFSGFNFFPYGLLAGIFAFANQPIRIWNTLLIIQNRIKRLALLSIVRVVTALSLSILFIVVFQMGVIGRILAMILSVSILFMFSLHDVHSYVAKRYSIKKLKELLSFSFPLFPSVIFSFFLINTNRFMIKNYLDIEYLGQYEIAFRFAGIVLMISIGFKKMWSINYYENIVENKYSIISNSIKMILLMMSLFLSIFILFLPEVYYFLIDSQYWVTISIVPIIIIAICIQSLLPLVSSTLGYLNKFKNISIFFFLSCLVNILLNHILLKKYFIMGASLSLFVSYLFLWLIIFINGFKINKKFFKLKREISILILPVVSLTYFYTFNKITISIQNICLKIILILFWFIFLFLSSTITKVEVLKFHKMIFYKKAKMV